MTREKQPHEGEIWRKEGVVAKKIIKGLARSKCLFICITTTFAISVALKNTALVITHIFILIILLVLSLVEDKRAEEEVVLKEQKNEE